MFACAIMSKACLVLCFNQATGCTVVHIFSIHLLALRLWTLDFWGDKWLDGSPNRLSPLRIRLSCPDSSRQVKNFKKTTEHLSLKTCFNRNFCHPQLGMDTRRNNVQNFADVWKYERPYHLLNAFSHCHILRSADCFHVLDHAPTSFQLKIK